MSTQATDNKELVEFTVTKESKKVGAAHDAAMQGLIAVFKGEGNLAPTTKIPASDIDELINELAQEQTDALKVQFKDGAKALLASKVKYNQFIAQKKLEFQKAIDGKKKEFTGEANRLLGLIDNISEIKQQYAETLAS